MKQIRNFRKSIKLQKFDGGGLQMSADAGAFQSGVSGAGAGPSMDSSEGPGGVNEGGAGNSGSATKVAGAAAGGLGAMSTLVFNNPSSTNIAGNIGEEAAKYAGIGLGVGAAFGPIGMAVGAGIGAIGGGIRGYFNADQAKKDRKKRQIVEHDYTVAADFANRSQESSRKRANELYDWNSGVYKQSSAIGGRVMQLSDPMKYGAYNQRGVNEMQTMRKGGIKKYPTGGSTKPVNSELEKGEPFMLPDGNIMMVPDSAPTHQQGGVKLNLPEYTKILGDNKMPDGTEFKDYGKKLYKLQNKYQDVLDKDPNTVARKTASLMLKKVDKEYKAAMLLQELQKELKTKDSLAHSYQRPVYHGLDEEERQTAVSDEQFNPNEYKSGGIHIKKSHRGKFTEYLKRTGKTASEAKHSKDPRVRKMATFALNAKKWKHPDGGIIQYPGGGSVSENEFMTPKAGNVPSIEPSVTMPDYRFMNMGDTNAQNINWFRDRYKDKKKAAKEYTKRYIPKGASQTVGFDDQDNMYLYNMDKNTEESYGAERKNNGAYVPTMFKQGGIQKYAKGDSISDTPSYWVDWSGNPVSQADYGRGMDFMQSTPGGGSADRKQVQDNLTPIYSYSDYSSKGKGPVANSNQSWQGYSFNNPLGQYTSNTQGSKPGTTPAKGFQDMYGQQPKWQTGLEVAGLAAPMAYNLVQGLSKVKQANASDFYNPYKADIMSALDKNDTDINQLAKDLADNPYDKDIANNPYEQPLMQTTDQLYGRKYDINPLLSEIRTGNRIADSNAANYSRTPGEMLNRMSGNVAQRNQAMAQAYAQKNNIENQWLGEAAGAKSNAINTLMQDRFNNLGRMASSRDQNLMSVASMKQGVAGAKAQALTQLGNQEAGTKLQTYAMNEQAKANRQKAWSEFATNAQDAIKGYMSLKNKQKMDSVRAKVLQDAFQYYNTDPNYLFAVLNSPFMMQGQADYQFSNQPMYQFKNKGK
jgi:hypothetical protein